MIFAMLLLVVAGVAVAVHLRRLYRWDVVSVGRADSRAAPWFQLATYADGRITHLTPMRDGIHIEDESGDCGCHPRAGSYRAEGDRPGVFYVHRQRSQGSAAPTTRVPKRFRAGWRWPE